MTVPPLRRHQRAFTLMELLVVVTIILILAAIAVPTYLMIMRSSHQVTALNTLRQITTAFGTYLAQNDQALPLEDAVGVDTWDAASKPESVNVWYNALPKILGYRGVGEYGTKVKEFYTKENILFLPGARYPDDNSKFQLPLFAYAINTKLQRKDKLGVKEPGRTSVITSPSRTVIFLEQGLPKEEKATAQQPKYDGSCKGSAKSFVARYGGKGILSFMDGHADAVLGSDVLSPTGGFIYPQEKIVWTRTPEEDPNK